MRDARASRSRFSKQQKKQASGKRKTGVNPRTKTPYVRKASGASNYGGKIVVNSRQTNKNINRKRWNETKYRSHGRNTSMGRLKAFTKWGSKRKDAWSLCGCWSTRFIRPPRPGVVSSESVTAQSPQCDRRPCFVQQERPPVFCAAREAFSAIEFCLPTQEPSPEFACNTVHKHMNNIKHTIWHDLNYTYNCDCDLIALLRCKTLRVFKPYVKRYVYSSLTYTCNSTRIWINVQVYICQSPYFLLFAFGLMPAGHGNS